MSSFHPNLNQLNRIIESKVIVKILTSVRAGIQIQIRLWIIPGFFTFGKLLVDLEESRFSRVSRELYQIEFSKS